MYTRNANRLHAAPYTLEYRSLHQARSYLCLRRQFRLIYFLHGVHRFEIMKTAPRRIMSRLDILTWLLQPEFRGKKKHNCDISDESEGCSIPRSMFHNHSYMLGFIQRNRAFVLQHGGLHISTREAVPPRASHGQGSFGHISHVCFLS